MFIFLSSSSRDRYENDVLRNLSAPIGSQVTFRYRNVHVEDSIVENKLTSTGNCEGLMCHVNIRKQGKGKIIPIRFVTVKSFLNPGSTLVVELEMREFAEYECNLFNDEISSTSEWADNIPERKNEEVEGSFVFTVENKHLTGSRDISNWESIVDKVYNYGSVENEVYFLTTGVHRGTPEELEAAKEWEETICVNTNYNIFVYIYTPSGSISGADFDYLHLSSSVEVESKNPRDLVVNAPHDLKKWGVRVPTQSLLGTGYEWFGRKEGWVQIGPRARREENSEATPFAWQVNLDLRYGRSWKVGILVGILLGIILATPVFHGMWMPLKMTFGESLLTGGLALLFGFSAATIILILPLFPSLGEWIRSNP
jgi:hypothetical protein